MSAFLAVIKKVTKRECAFIRENRKLICAMLFIPLVLCFFVAKIFSAGTLYDLPIAVLDEDNSEISAKIIRQIEALPSCQVKYRVLNLADGEALIKEGSVYALFVVPRDFGRNLLRKSQPQLVLYFNNQLLLVGGIISKDITAAVRSLGASYGAKPTVMVDEHVRSNPYMNYAYFLALGSFAHIFQIIIAFLAIFSFGSEFKNGTTKQLMETADNSIVCALFGKLLPYYLLCTLLILTVFSLYYIAFAPPFEGSIIALLLATCLFIFAYQMMGVFFVAITANLRLSLSFAAFYTAMGFTFAGLTFPLFAMPYLARIYAYLLPLTHYLKILTSQTLRGISPKYDLPSFLALFAIILFALLSLPILKKKFYDESTWGRI